MKLAYREGARRLNSSSEGLMRRKKMPSSLLGSGSAVTETQRSFSVRHSGSASEVDLNVCKLARSDVALRCGKSAVRYGVGMRWRP